jgi:hypothetical protein
LFGSSATAPTASPAGIKKTRFRCQHCGEGFFPKRTDRLQFCSRECAFESKKAAAADRKLARQEHEAERRARITAEAKSRLLAKQEQREARRAELRLKPCATCGRPVGLPAKSLVKRVYCSRACDPTQLVYRQEYRKAHRKIYGHKYRDSARYHGVDYEHVPPTAMCNVPVVGATLPRVVG